MEFEWDPGKADLNRKKHGVTFLETASAFDDPRVLVEHDLSHSEDEERWLAFGISEKGRVLVVTHVSCGQDSDHQRASSNPHGGRTVWQSVKFVW